MLFLRAWRVASALVPIKSWGLRLCSSQSGEVHIVQHIMSLRLGPSFNSSSRYVGSACPSERAIFKTSSALSVVCLASFCGSFSDPILLAVALNTFAPPFFSNFSATPPHSAQPQVDIIIIIRKHTHLPQVKWQPQPQKMTRSKRCLLSLK